MPICDEQKYPFFQVLECCWEEFMVQINDSKDLDHIIAAHETFLSKVMTRALMDNESRVSTPVQPQEVRNRRQILFLLLRKFKRINQLLFSLESSESRKFSDDFRGTRS